MAIELPQLSLDLGPDLVIVPVDLDGNHYEPIPVTEGKAGEDFRAASLFAYLATKRPNDSIRAELDRKAASLGCARQDEQLGLPRR